jgi:hypothetical protein
MQACALSQRSCCTLLFTHGMLYFTATGSQGQCWGVGGVQVLGGQAGARDEAAPDHEQVLQHGHSHCRQLRLAALTGQCHLQGRLQGTHMAAIFKSNILIAINVQRHVVQH